MSAGVVSNNVADRLRWLQARSKVLAENVANADTPKFTPRDLVPQGSDGPAIRATNPRHIGSGGAGTATSPAPRVETRPGGNAVSLEDEMLKLSETQLEYQMLTGLYQRSFALLRTAIGKRS